MKGPPWASGVGLLVLGRLIARDQDQALSRAWVSKFYHDSTSIRSPSLTSSCNPSWNMWSTSPTLAAGRLSPEYNTPASIVKCCEGKAALPSHPSTPSTTALGGCARGSLDYMGGLPEGIHSYPGFTGRSTQYHIGALDASSAVDRSRACHRRRPLHTCPAGHPSAATIICLRTPSQVIAVTNCGLRISKPCGWPCPRLPTPIVRVVCEAWSRSWVSSIRKYRS